MTSSTPIFRQSFEGVFRRRWEGLYRYLHRLTGDSDMASDVAQEAFVRLYRRRVLPDDVGAWLVSVAHNLLRDAARRRSRRNRLLATWRSSVPGPARTPEPDGPVEAQEARGRVRATLAGLPERQRRVLLLRAEGMKYREIAAAMGMPEGSVGQTLARALKAFRNAQEEMHHASHGR